MSKRISITFNLVPTLTVVFLVLKLCKVIDWSWWWVLSPSWIPAVLMLILLILKELSNAKVCRY
jgi:hypothetical protein